MSQTYVVELEGYRIGKRLYIKEICLLDPSGEVYDHRFCKIPPSKSPLPMDYHKTASYIYNHVHGIPFHLPGLDKSLPRIPARSLLITHGTEKAGLLQRLYPHCKAISWKHELSYDKLYLEVQHLTRKVNNAKKITCCSLLDHGPNCALVKAHKLLLLLNCNNVF